MLYLILLCTFLLLFILTCFSLLMRKRLSRQMLLGVCIVSFVFSLLFPLRYILRNPFLKEQVSVTVLREKNDASFGTDVVIQYIDSNYSERKLDNPIEGKWAWWNGTYRWSEEWEKQGLHPTDTIVMDVPVGYDRYIYFSIGPGYGKVEVACLESDQLVDLYSGVESILPIKLPASLHEDYLRDRLLRTAAFAGVAILITLSLTGVALLLNRKSNWYTFLKTWKYEAFVFLLSLMNIVLTGWYPNTYNYPTSYYFMPYENGFNSRGLTGTLTMLIGGPYVEENELARYILVILILAYLFFSILIVRMAKKESDFWMGIFWVLLYLLVPFSFLQIYDDARPDLYLIILFLIGAILVNKGRLLRLIPVICVILILINETSSAFFVAPLLAMLLYCLVKEKTVGHFVSFISSVAFTCITGLGVLRLDKGRLISLDSFFAHMSMHTNASLDYAAFSAEYKDSEVVLNTFANTMGNQFHQNYEALDNSILYFILVIPFVLLLTMIWKAVFKKLKIQYKDKGTSWLYVKFLYLILLLASCGGIICMLMAFDYLRFTEFIMIAMLASLFTVIHKEKLSLEINELYLILPPKREVPLAPFAILLYMSSWGTIDVWARNMPFFLNIAKILNDFFGI